MIPYNRMIDVAASAVRVEAGRTPGETKREGE